MAEAKTKKILVLLGNPDNETFSGKLADAYQNAAQDAGHEVVRRNIGDLRFDPVLYKGYKEIQELEPDLVDMQDQWEWADHIVIVYPNWWCAMPAVLKGLFDRFYLPGFAFNFDKKAKKCIKLFDGKTARVVVVAGTHSPFMTWLKYGDYSNEITHGILGFSGIKAKLTSFGPTNNVSEATHEKWIKKIEALGKRGA